VGRGNYVERAIGKRELQGEGELHDIGEEGTIGGRARGGGERARERGNVLTTGRERESYRGRGR
jgi:hypothetical protein